MQYDVIVKNQATSRNASAALNTETGGWQLVYYIVMNASMLWYSMGEIPEALHYSHVARNGRAK